MKVAYKLWSMFAETPRKTFPEMEEEVLAFWQSAEIFKKSLTQREGQPFFSALDGPPFATGLPHYGHLLTGTIKDVVLRYKTMKGFYVPRRFGWDCHGLPIENEVEKTLGLTGGAAAIEEYGIARFNETCRSIVLRYTSEWETTVHRMGRFVDFKNVWRTMDPTFMESVWWVFKQLYDKGFVYKGLRVMPVSTKLGTPLSNFEASENYKEIDDPSLTISLPLVDEPETSLLIWTTTPWTLPSNLAAMVAPGVDYVKVFDPSRDRFFILAEARSKVLFPPESGAEIRARFLGDALVGRRYVPPFDYFASRNAFVVIPSHDVSVDEGTGIVHAAPAFGEADFQACAEAGIEPVCPVTINGIFTSEVSDYAGRHVKEAELDIVRQLRRNGRLFHETRIHHRYPFCWRSDTPLIYRVMETWFVRVAQMREALLAANSKIHWTPGHIKEGRFGKWLAAARDWNIARNRSWGTPIPLWQSSDGETIAIGSVQELEGLTGKRVTDLHRHFIDDLTFEKNGKTFRRIPEVFDCWFESGSAPYGQYHYPFENQALTDKSMPADFIAEGLDQTRAWFYTLTVLSTALFNRPAFRNVIVNGIVLAEDGAKMSKRLRNYPEPSIVINRFGADAIRLYLLHSPAAKADDLRFSEHGVELVMRQILLPLWNAYTFLATYARIYKWQPAAEPPTAVLPIDRWMVSVLHKLIHDVETGMDGYDLPLAVEPFVAFIDQLTNWYIRLNRRRFWEKGAQVEDERAFSVLHHVLLTLTKIAAPYIPFLSEAIYQQLRLPQMPESVHLSDYPHYDAAARDAELEGAMGAAQVVVSLGHGLRKAHGIKVRQPLARAHVASTNQDLLNFLHDQRALIAAELNVKEVELTHDERQFVLLSAKPNFRVLGKKVGDKMREVQSRIAELDHSMLERLWQGEEITIQVAGASVSLSPDDVLVERRVKPGMDAANAGELTVAIDTALTDELLVEGLARELVNKISTMRREADLDYTDRITVVLQSTPRVKDAVLQHEAYLKNEVLATKIEFGQCTGEEWDLNGEPARVSIEKV